MEPRVLLHFVITHRNSNPKPARCIFLVPKQTAVTHFNCRNIILTSAAVPSNEPRPPFFNSTKNSSILSAHNNLDLRVMERRAECKLDLGFLSILYGTLQHSSLTHRFMWISATPQRKFIATAVSEQSSPAPKLDDKRKRSKMKETGLALQTLRANYQIRLNYKSHQRLRCWKTSTT